MFKKSLLSLAVASSLALTGCLDSGSSSKNAHPTPEFSNTPTEGRTWPVFNPLQEQIPIPSDLIIDQAQGDGTYGVTPDPTNPVISALNELSGASTVAPIDIEMSGAIDPKTVNEHSVFLIGLEYASGSPLQGFAIGEAPTIGHIPMIGATRIELDGKDFIRINPLEPLKPATRYIVVITNQVKDAGGQPLISDLVYGNTASDADLLHDGLAPVRKLVKGLWEPVAAKFFQAINGSRQAANLSPLSRQDIVLSFSLTTSGDEKVVEYIANPAKWLNDQITTFVRLSAVKAVLAQQPTADYNMLNQQADAAVAAFPSEAIQKAMGPVFEYAPPNGCMGLTGDTAIGCAATALASQFPFPVPKDRSDTIELGMPLPVPAVSIVAGSLPGAPDANVVQGSIELPYYLGTDASTVQTQSWQANDALATAINTAFREIGLSLPHGLAIDPDTGNPIPETIKSTTVNYLFPFPKVKEESVKVPMVSVYNRAAVEADQKLPVVIYQHGITTDRSAILSVGSVLAANGYAVVGIDLPLHGIGAFTTADQRELALTLLTKAGRIDETTPAPVVEGTIDAVINKTFSTGALQQIINDVCSATAPSFSVDFTDPEAVALGKLQVMGGACGELGQAPMVSAVGLESSVANVGSRIPGIARTDDERHFNLTVDAEGKPTAMDFANGTGKSGDLFINLLNFTNTRDKIRQNSVDLLNLLQSLSKVDLDKDGNPDFDMSRVYFVGHSLGTIGGTAFVAAANSTPSLPDVKAATLLTPASGIVRMLENSPQFAPTIVGGLYQRANIQQGSENYELFLRTLQATLDSTDPINFADNLSGIATDSFQTNAATGILITEVAGTADPNGNTLFPSDQTTIIEAGTVQLETQFGKPVSPDYLAGSEALALHMAATNVMDAGAPDATPDILLSRLGYGSHGMFVMPVMTADEKAGKTAQEITNEENRRGAAFKEAVTQMVEFFTAGGQLAGPVPANGRTGVPGVLIDDASFEARERKQLNPN